MKAHSSNTGSKGVSRAGIHDTVLSTRCTSRNSVIDHVYTLIVPLKVTRMDVGQLTATKHVTMRVGHKEINNNNEQP